MLALLQQNLIPKLPLDKWTSSFVDYVKHIKAIGNFFDFVKGAIGAAVGALEAILTAPPELLMVAVFAAIAFFVSGWRVALFAVLGFLLIISLGLWDATMLSLALVLTATVISLLIGVPIGVLAAKSQVAEAAARPTLDIMQTMPAFVYLVPMVVFLGLGSTPALVATVIFAAPPAVRLTMLGIQQVPQNTVEAAQAFGATPWQTLRKVELPQALPTIMAGVNQVIMLALSMVVIAALVGAGGLGESVVRGLTQLNVGQAFVGGIGIVVIAIYLDRVTRPLGQIIQRKSGPKKALSKILPSRKKADTDPDTAGTTGAGAEETVGAGAQQGPR
ncbi:MAG: proline/glycine betaine ABC transporter permease [Actinobacteria bacterium]|nr:proline/glycine betaine ABC transporter permease [Actinomycetota bacterium]